MIFMFLIYVLLQCYQKENLTEAISLLLFLWSWQTFASRTSDNNRREEISMGFRQYLLCGTPAVLDSILVFPSLAEPWWMLQGPSCPCHPWPRGWAHLCRLCPQRGDCPGPAWLTALVSPGEGRCHTGTCRAVTHCHQTQPRRHDSWLSLGLAMELPMGFCSWWRQWSSNPLSWAACAVNKLEQLSHFCDSVSKTSVLALDD